MNDDHAEGISRRELITGLAGAALAALWPVFAVLCGSALALDAHPANCVYLDDLGINLKPARDMGMTTIKVTSEQQAIDDLSRILGIDFGV